jgi:hypothetical protein
MQETEAYRLGRLPDYSKQKGRSLDFRKNTKREKRNNDE